MPAFELRSPDGTVFRLKGEVIRLGRASDNAIVVNDAAVSRYHVNFYIKDGELIAEDAGSANGFSVNGEVCKTSVKLTIGDQLVIGSRLYQVDDPASPQPTQQQVPQPGNLRMASDMGAAQPRMQTGTPRRAKIVAKKQALSTPAILSIVTLVIVVLVYAREGEKTASRAPASVSTPLKSTPLPTDGFHEKTFTPHSTSEIKAEARFRESLRDYYNGNYSRAMIGFKDALTMMPSHEGANEYLMQAEAALKDQLTELLEDGQRSMTILQYQRARGQALRILSIVSEQIPQYSRKIASDVYASGPEKQIPEQEQILLEVPCDSAKKYAEVCKKAVELLKQTQKLLGEEDSLK